MKANEERILLLTKDKTKLEKDIVDMTKSSGDSSTLITELNEEIKQKERSAFIRSIQLTKNKTIERENNLRISLIWLVGAEIDTKSITAN